VLVCVLSVDARTQASAGQTPLQRQIAEHRQHLSADDREVRRDAVMLLGAMHRPDASRVASAALTDPDEIVRATAAHAVLSLPADETVPLLVQLLNDKKEFVRREAAYALGQTHSPKAVPDLTRVFGADKEAGVRGAAAVALGEIGDSSAVVPLISALHHSIEGSKRSGHGENNEFVLRSAVRALGQIRDRVAVSTLAGILTDKRSASDVKREAAFALGRIGDPSALDALDLAESSSDPYLSQIASEAKKRINRERANRTLE
jgi:HEAT repeat protein